MREPARPRPPGRPQSMADRLRRISPASLTSPIIITAGVAILLVFLVPWLFGPTANTPTEDGLQTQVAGPEIALASSIEVPLSLDEVGFAGGIVEATPIDEGPGAASYCNTSPSTDGLVSWNANRLTEDGGRHRLGQLVAHFESSIHATAFLGATSGLADCESWRGGSEDEPVTFTVTEVTPSRIFADETKQFELQAQRPTSVLYLRTYLVRSGSKVAQLTYVAPDPNDLADLDTLMTQAVANLGF